MHATRALAAEIRSSSCVRARWNLSVSFKCNAENAHASGGIDFMEDRTRDDALPSGLLHFPDRTLRVIV